MSRQFAIAIAIAKSHHVLQLQLQSHVMFCNCNCKVMSVCAIASHVIVCIYMDVSHFFRLWKYKIIATQKHELYFVFVMLFSLWTATFFCKCADCINLIAFANSIKSVYNLLIIHINDVHALFLTFHMPFAFLWCASKMHQYVVINLLPSIIYFVLLGCKVTLHCNVMLFISNILRIT